MGGSLSIVEANLRPDRLCEEGAASQHGLITRAQALEAGLNERQIGWRIHLGRWRPLHPSVFAINGAPPSWHQHLLAACLWAGPLAAASYRAAAILWKLDGVFERLIEISVPRKLSANDVIIHRVGVDLSSIRIREGIPVTDPTTTLFNLAAVLHPFHMESALESALRMQLTHLDRLWATLLETARPGRNGIRLMRRLLEHRNPSMVPTASQLETTLSRLIDRFGLPKPVRQYVITDEGGSFVARPDFAYPEAKVAIEAQSYAHHHGRRDWERDQDRQSAMTASGWIVVYVTDRQMKDHPELVAQRVLRALRNRAEH